MSSFREDMNIPISNNGPSISDIQAAEDACGNPSSFCEKNATAIIIVGLLFVITMVTLIGIYMTEFKALGPLGTLITIFTVFAISSSLGYVAGGCKFHKKIKKSLLNKEPKIHHETTTTTTMADVVEQVQAQAKIQAQERIA